MRTHFITCKWRLTKKVGKKLLILIINIKSNFNKCKVFK